MYFYVETAKGKRINEALRKQHFIMEGNTEGIDFKTIKKGEKCLVFSNGTIGAGARSFNYKKRDAVGMLKKLITELERK
jgi:hypothetical protein